LNCLGPVDRLGIHGRTEPAVSRSPAESGVTIPLNQQLEGKISLSGNVVLTGQVETLDAVFPTAQMAPTAGQP
jgi:hypothetical protein